MSSLYEQSEDKSNNGCKLHFLSTIGKSAYFSSVAYTVADLEFLKEIHPIDLRPTTSVSSVLPEAGVRNGKQKVYHLY